VSDLVKRSPEVLYCFVIVPLEGNVDVCDVIYIYMSINDIRMTRGLIHYSLIY